MFSILTIKYVNRVNPSRVANHRSGGDLLLQQHPEPQRRDESNRAEFRDIKKSHVRGYVARYFEFRCERRVQHP